MVNSKVRLDRALIELWVSQFTAGEWDQMVIRGPCQLKPVCDSMILSVQPSSLLSLNHKESHDSFLCC